MLALLTGLIAALSGLAVAVYVPRQTELIAQQATAAQQSLERQQSLEHASSALTICALWRMLVSGTVLTRTYLP